MALRAERGRAGPFFLLTLGWRQCSPQRAQAVAECQRTAPAGQALQAGPPAAEVLRAEVHARGWGATSPFLPGPEMGGTGGGSALDLLSQSTSDLRLHSSGQLGAVTASRGAQRWPPFLLFPEFQNRRAAVPGVGRGSPRGVGGVGHRLLHLPGRARGAARRQQDRGSLGRAWPGSRDRAPACPSVEGSRQRPHGLFWMTGPQCGWAVRPLSWPKGALVCKHGVLGPHTLSPL